MDRIVMIVDRNQPEFLRGIAAHYCTAGPATKGAQATRHAGAVLASAHRRIFKKIKA